MNSLRKAQAHPFCVLLALMSVIHPLLAGTSPDEKRRAAGRSEHAQRPPPFAARLDFASVPLHFEANQGQAQRDVKFLARGPGYGAFLSPNEVVLTLQRAGDAAALNEPNRATPVFTSLRLRLEGANAFSGFEGEDELPGRIHYLLGSDPSQWRTNVATFRRVRRRDVYPGIDVVYYGNQRRLEYDFVVAPGASPEAIEIQFEGAGRIETDEAGDLILRVSGGEVRQQRPVVYQEADGIRRAIAGRYRLMGGQRVRFEIGDYDCSRPLTIDPVLVYSTYFGSSAPEEPEGIAVDASRNVFIAGTTRTYPDFPFLNAYQTDKAPQFYDDVTGLYVNTNAANAFLMRLGPDGSLVFATYFGGSESDFGLGLAIDNASNAYLCGTTRTAPATQPSGERYNFPITPGAYRTTWERGQFNNGSAAFVAKFNAAGGLVYSTFLMTDKPSAFDPPESQARGIAVDATGNAYVTGWLVTYAFGGSYALFVAKLNSTGSAQIHEKQIPAAVGNAIAVDSTGAAYVTGRNESFGTAFPTTASALHPATSSDADCPFFFKLDAAGTNLLYSTLIAPYNRGFGRAITVDSFGHAYVAGDLGEPSPTPTARNFRLKNPFQAQFGGGAWDVFIAKFDPTLSGTNSLLYSTYLGGAGNDTLRDGDQGDRTGTGVQVDALGRIYVAGSTASTNFPISNALQTNYAGGRNDAFVAQLNAAGSGMIFSTYLGGSGADSSSGVAVDLTAENLFVTGTTESGDFRTLNAVQSSLKGGPDAFVARLLLAEPEPAFIVNTTDEQDDGFCDTAHCSLREAINASNETPGRQTIEFDIPGSGIPLITPLEWLPGITDPAVIDGTTQPGSGLVQLSGILAPANAPGGLHVRAGQTEVRGLVITAWKGPGIGIEGQGTNRIQGNFIGIHPDLPATGNTGSGIRVAASSQNLIGGSTPADRNVISGNDAYGIEIAAGANENDVFGNIIGSDAAGTAARGNRLGGVLVESYGNRIGAPTSSPGQPPGNLISAHLAAPGQPAAIRVQGESAFANQIVGNLIGTTLAGDTSLANTIGILIDESPDNRVGGPDPASRNVISSSVQDGIVIQGRHAIDNRIQGNFIGTHIQGGYGMGNRGRGVVLGEKTILGGLSSQPGAPPGNVISGNDGDGVYISGSDNRIEGNLIGLDRDGTYAVSNGRQGIFIDAGNAPAFANVIGGRVAGLRNVIGGNRRDGVRIEGPISANSQVDLLNRIEGNWIGITTGGAGVSNEFNGVAIVDATGNVVGGSTPEAANQVAFNGEAGVRIGGAFGTRNVIAGNSIHGNARLGIDLGTEGVTPNDALDGDTGANRLQNFPESLRAVDFGDSLVVRGFLDSEPNRIYRIEFFGNTLCDPSGHGQGATFLGTQIVRLGLFAGDGFLSILPRPAGVAFVTATATDPEGGTSEFSACGALQPPSDPDGDGSDDAIEDGAPNDGDGNNDGTPDRQQPNVGSSIGWTAQKYITAELPAGNSFKNFDTPTLLPGEMPFSMRAQFPYDRLRFEVQTPPNGNGPRPQGPGDAVMVTLYLPPGSAANAYYMFGPTPGNTTPHWYEFTFDGTTGAVFETNKVVLHFIDGQRGDHDLTANGAIVSAGALAIAGNIPLRIADFALLPLGQVFLRVSGEAWRTYEVQSSTNLISWTTGITTNSASGVFDHVDAPAVSSDERYYRVFQQP